MLITAFIKKNQVLIVSALLALFSLHIAFTSKATFSGGEIVSGAVGVVTTPLQNMITDIKSSTTSILDDYILLIDVRDKNKYLQDAVLELKNENTRLREEAALSLRLKGLLEYRESRDLKSVAAEVIGAGALTPAGGWTRVSLLDKGIRDSITEDMAVISPEGVVGRVIDVRGSASKALLIIDPRSRIDVMVQRSRARGVVEGNGSGDLSLKYILELEDLHLGDKIVTSGLAGIYPKGLLVGEVTKTEKGSDNFFKSVTVTPQVSFHNLEEVLIVTDRGVETENLGKGQMPFTE